MKLAFTSGAVLLGAFSLTAQAQTFTKPQYITKPPVSVKPMTGIFNGGGDDCAAPDAILGAGTFNFDNTVATTGTEGQNESNCYFFGSSGVDADVWFSWTSDFTGLATMSMCGGATNDTKIAAYPGGGCPTDGTSLACNDDTCGLQSEIQFSVTTGTAYMLQVGSFPGGSTGAGTFTISAPAPPPANDDCATATAISGSGNYAFDLNGATTGIDGQSESICYFFGSTAIDADVWYSWTADFTGTALMSTCIGNTVDTKIAAYPGGGCPTAGSSLACNDDSCGLQSEITFPVVSGTAYMLQVGTFPGATPDAGSFDIGQAPAPCTNNADDCATPSIIAGQGTFCWDTLTATTGLEGQNETLCYDFGTSAVNNDIWYEWTADATGPATVTMCNTGVTVDTKIAAYPGGGCPTDGTSLACNDDTCGLQSEITFNVVAGTSYMLQIGHFSTAANDEGLMEISIAGPPTIGTNYCTAAANSVSASGSVMSASGSASFAANNLTITADNAPNQPAIFYYGPNQINLAFGNGFRCVGGTVVRMPAVVGSGGFFNYTVDMIGDGLSVGTHNFQCWYRDPAGGGAFFNLSDGLEVVVTP